MVMTLAGGFETIFVEYSSISSDWTKLINNFNVNNSIFNFSNSPFQDGSHVFPLEKQEKN